MSGQGQGKCHMYNYDYVYLRDMSPPGRQLRIVVLTFCNGSVLLTSAGGPCGVSLPHAAQFKRNRTLVSVNTLLTAR